MFKRLMMPLTLSAHTLVTANGCSWIAELAAICPDCCGERGRGNV